MRNGDDLERTVTDRCVHLAVAGSLRGSLVELLDSFDNPRHDLGSIAVKGSRDSRIAEISQGDPFARSVLEELAAKGDEVFDRVSRNLGRGREVWNKYLEECYQNIDKMIRKYG